MCIRMDDGQLTIDFSVGFAIFILSLGMVASFVPGLLAGLQRTSGIDYDAVAYRTGVILVEDPGAPVGHEVGMPGANLSLPWELMPLLDPGNVSRFGLAIDADHPNILSINKIEKFFNASLLGGDYRKQMLFSTYGYSYNISLKSITPMGPDYPLGLTRRVGDPYPESVYGYIRRYVMIKQNPNMTVTFQDVRTPQQAPGNYTVMLNGNALYNKGIDTPYTIDLQREPTIINLTNLGVLPKATTQHLLWINITNQSATVTINQSLEAARANLTVDGNPINLTDPFAEPVQATSFARLRIDSLDPREFYDGTTINITFQFDTTESLIWGAKQYDYSTVTPPDLAEGVLEVGIW